MSARRRARVAKTEAASPRSPAVAPSSSQGPRPLAVTAAAILAFVSAALFAVGSMAAFLTFSFFRNWGNAFSAFGGIPPASGFSLGETAILAALFLAAALAIGLGVGALRGARGAWIGLVAGSAAWTALVAVFAITGRLGPTAALPLATLALLLTRDARAWFGVRSYRLAATAS